MEILARRIVRFGAFEVDTLSGELRKGGRKIRPPEQSFQVLALLLDRAGEVVTREELRQRLWPAGTFVDFDAGLNNAVRKLRDALGDSAEIPRYIETLPRRGYRFVAAVEAQPLPAPAEAEAPRLVRPVGGLLSRGVAAPVTAVVALAMGLTLSAGGIGGEATDQVPCRLHRLPCFPSKTSPETASRTTSSMA